MCKTLVRNMLNAVNVRCPTSLQDRGPILPEQSVM